MTKWRFTCPHGDTAWIPRLNDSKNGGPAQSRFYCRTCRKYDRDPHFDSLVDQKTGNRVQNANRSQV